MMPESCEYCPAQPEEIVPAIKAGAFCRSQGEQEARNDAQHSAHAVRPGQIGTNPPAAAYACGMTETKNPFAHLSLEKAIALRWTLRDIKAKRLVLSPVSDEDLATLRELGLVEMKSDLPVLTEAGQEALD